MRLHQPSSLLNLHCNTLQCYAMQCSAELSLPFPPQIVVSGQPLAHLLPAFGFSFSFRLSFLSKKPKGSLDRPAVQTMFITILRILNIKYCEHFNIFSQPAQNC